MSEKTEEEPPAATPATSGALGLKAEGQLLQSLMAHWIHEDTLFWTQIRHLLILQLAALGAWFALGVTLLNVMLMSATFLLSVRLYFLADVIRKNRDSNLQTIAVVSLQSASAETIKLVKEKLGDRFDEQWGMLRITQHRLTDVEDAGKHFQFQVFGACLLLNLLLGVTVSSDHFYHTDFFNHLYSKSSTTADGSAKAQQTVPPDAAASKKMRSSLSKSH